MANTTDRGNDLFELMDTHEQTAVIKVMGIGGGGGNAVQHMVNSCVEGVDFVCANTDAQALKNCTAKTLLQLGGGITKGLGAGADPEIGKQAALEDRDIIKEVIQDTDMLFITAGMGGGTGTGAAPEIAKIAREMDVLTVAVVTKPFKFEGDRRMKAAVKGIEELGQHVDSLITIPNEKLVTCLGENVTLLNGFKEADNILFGAVQGIAELITRPGLINVDFADVKTVMAETGVAMMGTGSASGSNRAVEAAENAINSPLLEDINVVGAAGVLVNVTAGPDLQISEYEAVGATISSIMRDNATVVIGNVIDPAMIDDLRVTLVATGLDASASSSQGEQETEATHLEEAAPDVSDQNIAVEAQPEFEVAHEEETQELIFEESEDQYIESEMTVSGDTISEDTISEDTVSVTEADPDPDDADYERKDLDVPAFLRRQAD